MIEFVQHLTPEQQAVLAGMLASAAYALYKAIAARLGAVDETQGAKMRQLLGVAAVTGLAALVATLQGGGFAVGEFLGAWALAFLGAQSAHGAVKSLRHVGEAVVEGR